MIFLTENTVLLIKTPEKKAIETPFLCKKNKEIWIR